MTIDNKQRSVSWQRVAEEMQSERDAAKRDAMRMQDERDAAIAEAAALRAELEALRVHTVG